MNLNNPKNQISILNINEDTALDYYVSEAKNKVSKEKDTYKSILIDVEDGKETVSYWEE